MLLLLDYPAQPLPPHSMARRRRSTARRSSHIWSPLLVSQLIRCLRYLMGWGQPLVEAKINTFSGAQLFRWEGVKLAKAEHPKFQIFSSLIRWLKQQESRLKCWRLCPRSSRLQLGWQMFRVSSLDLFFNSESRGACEVSLKRLAAATTTLTPSTSLKKGFWEGLDDSLYWSWDYLCWGDVSVLRSDDWWSSLRGLNVWFQSSSCWPP